MCGRILIGALASSCLLATAPETSQAFEIQQVQTERGNVPLYLPSATGTDAELPLVISLHGFTGNGSQHENYFNLRSRVDESQFMLCVPDGIPNGQGDRFWNATDFCCDFGGQRPDDSGYLRSLIETIIADHPVDLGSIHVVGHSNGGFMSYRMACDHADLVSSIASLAGASFADTSDCVPSEPVHVLQIHGTSDSTIGFYGGCIPFYACYPGALQSIMNWAVYNRCGEGMESGADLDLDGSIPGPETSRTIITAGCSDRGATELWAINGGSHGPSFNGNFRRELVDWLLSHRRNPVPVCSGDVDGDGFVGGEDLNDLLGAWGDASDLCDLDGDGVVGGPDLSIMLGVWGQCPDG